MQKFWIAFVAVTKQVTTLHNTDHRVHFFFTKPISSGAWHNSCFISIKFYSICMLEEKGPFLNLRKSNYRSLFSKSFRLESQKNYSDDHPAPTNNKCFRREI